MKRTRNPEGFYSKNWDDEQQEEDEWQVPNKFQMNSQIVSGKDLCREETEEVL